MARQKFPGRPTKNEQRDLRHPALQQLISLRARNLLDSYLSTLLDLPESYAGGYVSHDPQQSMPYQVVAFKLTCTGYASHAGLPFRKVTGRQVFQEDPEPRTVPKHRTAFHLLRKNAGRRFREEIQRLVDHIDTYLFTNARAFEETRVLRELRRWKKQYPEQSLVETTEHAQDGSPKAIDDLITWDPTWFFFRWIHLPILNPIFFDPMHVPDAGRIESTALDRLRGVGKILSGGPRRIRAWRRTKLETPNSAEGRPYDRTHRDMSLPENIKLAANVYGESSYPVQQPGHDRTPKTTKQQEVVELAVEIFVEWKLLTGSAASEDRKFIYSVVVYLKNDPEANRAGYFKHSSWSRRDASGYEFVRRALQARGLID